MVNRVFKLNKKLILLSSVLVLALFVISACANQDAVSKRIKKITPLDDGKNKEIIEKPKEVPIIKPTQPLNDTNYTQPINYTNYTQPPTNYTNYKEPPIINYTNY